MNTNNFPYTKETVLGEYFICDSVKDRDELIKILEGMGCNLPRYAVMEGLNVGVCFDGDICPDFDVCASLPDYYKGTTTHYPIPDTSTPVYGC